jgi:hypothetical protein
VALVLALYARLSPCDFQRTAVSRYPALRSPDLPPVTFDGNQRLSDRLRNELSQHSTLVAQSNHGFALSFAAAASFAACSRTQSGFFPGTHHLGFFTQSVNHSRVAPTSVRSHT